MGLVKRLTRNKLVPFRNPQDARFRSVRLVGGLNLLAGTVLAELQIAERNETQTITFTGSPTGGYIRIGWDGSYTAQIDIATISAANIQTAVNNLLGANAVAVTGTGPYVLTFSGNEYSRRDVTLGILDSVLTGGTTPTVAITESQKGSIGLVGQMAAYNDAGANGIAVARAVLYMDTQTDSAGRVLNEYGNPAGTDVMVYDAGEFLCSKLIGLDANAILDLGRLTSGSAFNVAGAVLRIGG